MSYVVIESARGRRRRRGKNAKTVFVAICPLIASICPAASGQSRAGREPRERER